MSNRPPEDPDAADELKSVRRRYARRAGPISPQRDADWIQLYLRNLRWATWARLLGEVSPAVQPTIVLEVGCGSGLNVPFVRAAFPGAMYLGLDLRADALAEAGRESRLSRVLGSAHTLPLRPSSVDAILVSTLFSSIHARSLRDVIAAEIREVLSDGGILLWSDMRLNNPWNADVVPIRRHEVRSLYEGSMDMRASRSVMAPQLARQLFRLAPWAVRAASAVPVMLCHWSAVGTIDAGAAIH